MQFYYNDKKSGDVLAAVHEDIQWGRHTVWQCVFTPIQSNRALYVWGECLPSYLKGKKRISPLRAKQVHPVVFNEAMSAVTQLVAAEFSRVLWQWSNDYAEDVDMHEVIRRNEAYTKAGDDDSCASHEMCDANMAMDEAMNKHHMRAIFPCMIDEIEDPKWNQWAQGEAAIQQDVWNNAWDLAKRHKFNAEAIDKLPPIKAITAQLSSHK
jgi:hypothetical protein